MACDSATVHRPKVRFPKKTWAFFQAAEAVSAGLILARWSRGSDRRRADRPKILACGSLATTDGSARHRGSQPNPQYDGRAKLTSPALQIAALSKSQSCTAEGGASGSQRPERSFSTINRFSTGRQLLLSKSNCFLEAVRRGLHLIVASGGVCVLSGSSAPSTC